MRVRANEARNKPLRPDGDPDVRGPASRPPALPKATPYETRKYDWER